MKKRCDPESEGGARASPHPKQVFASGRPPHRKGIRHQPTRPRQGRALSSHSKTGQPLSSGAFAFFSPSYFRCTVNGKRDFVENIFDCFATTSKIFSFFGKRTTLSSRTSRTKQETDLSSLAGAPGVRVFATRGLRVRTERDLPVRVKKKSAKSKRNEKSYVRFNFSQWWTWTRPQPKSLDF